MFLLVIVGIMRAMMSMRDSGTLDLNNAVGQGATVYVTIPPTGEGRGQVEILIQGRLATLQAVSDHLYPLAPQTPVEVTSIRAGNLLVVKPV